MIVGMRVWFGRSGECSQWQEQFNVLDLLALNSQKRLLTSHTIFIDYFCLRHSDGSRCHVGASCDLGMFCRKGSWIYKADLLRTAY